MKQFRLGKLLMTRGVNDLIADDGRFAKFVWDSLKKYRSGDWGQMCKEDRMLNDEAISNDNRILAAYEGEHKIWIITEWDRSATTILFPDEY